MSYDPKSARMYGPDWPVDRDEPTLLNSIARSLVVSVPKRSNEDIAAVALHMEGFNAFPVGITCDVFDQDHAESSSSGIERLGYNPTHPLALPNGDADAGNFVNQAAGTTNLWQSLDDGAVIDESTYIQASGLGNYKGVLNVALTTSGCSQWAAKRITRVDFDVYARVIGGDGFLLPRLVMGGGDIKCVDLGWIEGDQSLKHSHSSYILNPKTGKPWTAADIERFSFLDQYRLEWRGGNGLATVQVVSVAMAIYWVNETRKGSMTTIPPFFPAWPTFDLDTPDYFNALTAQQAGLESAALGTTGWTAGASTTIARSTTQAASGTASMLMIRTGTTGDASAGTGSIDLTESVAVYPGQVWSLAAKFRAQTTPRSCRVEAVWADENGTAIGSPVLGSSVTDSAAHFNTQAKLEGIVAPANARYLGIVPKALSCIAGEGHFADEFMAVQDELIPAAFVAGGGRRTFFSGRNGKRYAFSFHRSSESGAAKVWGPTADVACPHGVETYHPTIESFSGVGQVGVLGELGEPSLASAGIVLITTALGISADSQPYVGLDPLMVVHTGNDAEQEFTTGGGDTRSVVVLLVKLPVDDPLLPGLSVKIKNRGTGVQVGSTITIAAADLVEPRTRLQRVVKTMTTPAVLAGSTQYFVELTSTAPAATPWYAGVLYDGGLGSSAGFGASTDRYTNDAIGETENRDLFFLLATEPAPITGFDVTTVASPLPHAHIAWNPVVDANWSRIEIERDDGNGFEVIKVITDPATASYDDYQGRGGVTASYRMRWFRDEFIPSPYTAVDTATPAAPTKTFRFVKNDEDPATFLEYFVDQEDPFTWQFDDPHSIMDLYNSDDRVLAQGTEERGDRFNVTLTLYAGAALAPPTPGRRAFDPLRRLSKRGTVCVLGANGDRWLAKIAVADGEHQRPGNVYKTACLITELVPDNGG